ncbi:hypothetical protein [Actinophytocola sp.]|uniref:hypothetical protein n=1 Tax=Actinophytocola sp. TaxID=1872138 RepID=UPI002ED0204F
MAAPENDPDKVYKLSPEHMEESIELYLDPVIQELRRIAGIYRAAHDQARAAHVEETPGWFGGEGNGHVKPAISSFLNEVTFQVSELVGDQDELVASLQNYRDMLQAHINQAVQNDLAHADQFIAIHRELDEKRFW